MIKKVKLLKWGGKKRVIFKNWRENLVIEASSRDFNI